MYIGPWQEYNLSKTRASRVDEKLRPGIEQALLSSLDPATAQKAMEAMIPYFEKPVAPSQSRTGQGARENRKRTILTLPSLQQSPSVISARERSLQIASPLSVRSSQSEHIRYSNGQNKAAAKKLPASMEFTDSVYSTGATEHPGTLLPSLQQHAPYTQPAYNSPAMLNLLRLERNSRARSEIAKLTGWKSKSGSEPKEKAPNQADVIIQAKVDQVHKMKQLYLTGGAAAESTGTHLPPIRNPYANNNTVSKLTLTNLEEHNKSISQSSDATNDHEKQTNGDEEGPLKTPRVGDVDLDEAAFSLISKYFQGSTVGETAYNASNTGTGTSIPPGNVCGANSTIKEVRPIVLSPSQMRLLHEPHRKTPMNDDLTSETGSTYSVPYPSHNADAAGTGSISPYIGIGYEETATHTDEYYMGGIDGLLMWSSQLELDL